MPHRHHPRVRSPLRSRRGIPSNPLRRCGVPYRRHPNAALSEPSIPIPRPPDPARGQDDNLPHLPGAAMRPQGGPARLRGPRHAYIVMIDRRKRDPTTLCPRVQDPHHQLDLNAGRIRIMRAHVSDDLVCHGTTRFANTVRPQSNSACRRGQVIGRHRKECAVSPRSGRRDHFQAQVSDPVRLSR